MSVAQALEGILPGRVFSDPETLAEVDTDFGRIIRRVPCAVVAPTFTADVESVVRFGSAQGVSVSARGAARSQGGQALNQDGILLDMSTLNRIGRVEQGAIWVEGGALWSQVVRETVPQGWVPPVLPGQLEVSVGGTIASGGLGASSQRYGFQATHVLELEAVTGEGHSVRCSARQNRELFDCLRGGWGQFGFITRAKLRLRPCLPRVRTSFLLYDDLSHLIQDLRKMVEEERFDYVESWCAASLQGFQQLESTKIPLAEWFFPVQVSAELDDTNPPAQSRLEDLSFYRRIHCQETAICDFLNRGQTEIEFWRESGSWNLPHPCVGVFLPWNRAADYISGVLKVFPPQFLPAFRLPLQLCSQSGSALPPLLQGAAQRPVCFQLLPALRPEAVPLGCSLLRKASQLALGLGAKRHLSGWIEFESANWAEHFGASWKSITLWKRFYDPHSILNPDFIRYDSPDSSGEEV